MYERHVRLQLPKKTTELVNVVCRTIQTTLTAVINSLGRYFDIKRVENKIIVAYVYKFI